jgi:hypothetical protein
VALIWGRIYEEKADLYVQSYIRFLRLGEAEAVDVTLPGTGDLSFRARLPAQASALTPRKVAVRDLEEIERRGRATLVLHPSPGAGTGRPLAESPIEPLIYGVIAAQGDWMRIRSEITGREGWVRARLDDEAWALRRLMPELAYFDAVIGYLRLRTIEQTPLASAPQRVFGWVARAFNAYEEAVGRDAAPDAAGLAKSMMGLLLWTHPEIAEGGNGRVRAARMFAEAFERMPGSPEARMLAALTAPLLDDAPATGEKLVAGIDRGLLGALAIDPRNATALANLERLYGFAQRNPALSPYGPEQLKFRLDALKSARPERDGR